MIGGLFLAFFICCAKLPSLEAEFQRPKPLAAQKTVFSDTKKGKRLEEGWTMQIRARTRTGCAKACNRHPKCRSFTFCGRMVCKIHEQDIFSTDKNETILQNVDECFYTGMEKDEYPLCKQQGLYVDIKSDSGSGYCDIKNKRVDMEWGDWRGVDIFEDTAWDFQQGETRSVIIAAAHGGIISGDAAKVRISIFSGKLFTL